MGKFNGDSKYNIMFGPDICGSSTKKTHVIFNYKEKNLDKKTEVRAESDTLSHLYTLIVKPDNAYEVQIDMNKVDSGSLSEGWAFLEPRPRSPMTGMMGLMVHGRPPRSTTLNSRAPGRPRGSRTLPTRVCGRPS